MADAGTGPTTGHGALMDRVYRHQRHIYDLTRKYYLLGRDPMLAGLKPPRGGHVLEVGCGTGRNLVAAARLYPDAHLYGYDISSAMMETSAASVARAGLAGKVRLALADADGFDPQRSFGRQNFDRIFISYAVSMIPGWRDVIRDAASHLAPGGELHVVDFGDLAGLPGWMRGALYAWLRWYHVTPRNDLFDVVAEAARDAGGTARRGVLHHGFAWIAVLRR